MDKIWNAIKSAKAILILGAGREGLSTYAFIRKHDKNRIITIADLDKGIQKNVLFAKDKNLRFVTGKEYLSSLLGSDCIIKAPGVSLSEEMLARFAKVLHSQTSLFLEAYRDRVIGITGTKGKSTTATFIHHALVYSGKHSVLLGNMGIPPFDMLGDIRHDTVIVYELSSHMLQAISVSPHIAVFLNLFPEHLDYYGTMHRYSDAKAALFRNQKQSDLLISGDSLLVAELLRKHVVQSRFVTWGSSIPHSPDFFYREFTHAEHSQRGEHVLRNLALGAVAAHEAGANPLAIVRSLATFRSLPHRLEVVGTWRGVTFINDSISTIPEATLAALEAFPETNVLILGGMDRGIPYHALIEAIANRPELTVLCLDEAGKRIYREAKGRGSFVLSGSLEEAVTEAYAILPSGGTVLLSPAAASYTNFKNFEERGRAFAEYAKKHGL